jgi:hypothetical protein
LRPREPDSALGEFAVSSNAEADRSSYPRRTPMSRFSASGLQWRLLRVGSTHGLAEAYRASQLLSRMALPARTLSLQL